MTTNQEPKSATEPAGALDEEQIIDLDDVEGHGMREVAAGLGAAAVLAGTGTAAAAAVGVHPSLPDLRSTPSVSHPVDQADRATDWAIDTSRAVRDGSIDAASSVAGGAASLAGREVSATSHTAASVAGGAVRTSGAVVDVTASIAAAEARAAAQTAGQAETIALNTTRSTASGTMSTASSTTTNTTQAAGSTAAYAERKAATVLTLTTSTVNALETTIVATVANLNPEAGAGTSGMGSTGWVTFSLGGENIASVQLSNGQATVTVKTASLAGKTLQAVYSGDTIHASSLRAMEL
jgi:hypothetical protein